MSAVAPTTSVRGGRGAGDARHEAVVIGGGHNGLTCAAYLARAGVDVLVVEARDTVGGCASTIAPPSLGGARINVCNCDHALVRATGVIEELELHRHGLSYLDMDPAQLMVPWNGAAPWLLFRSVERTLQSLALTHPTQVRGYRRYCEELIPAAELVMAMTSGAPKPGSVARRLAARRGRGMRALLKLTRMSCQEVLARYFTDEALLGPPGVTGPSVWGIAPQQPGSGLGALGYALRHAIPVGRPVGGSGVLTDALAAAVRAAGGSIITGAGVATIRAAGGAVRGVTLTDGRRIDAPVVIASGDPRAALVDLLDRAPEQAAPQVERWRSRAEGEGYESKIDGVVSRVPRVKGVGDEYLAALGVDEPMTATLVMTPTSGQMQEAAGLAGAGRIHALPPMLVNTPSLLDASIVPPGGGHVFSLEVLFTPYSLREGWQATAEPQRWLEVFAERMEPGFLDTVQATRITAPPDYERDFSMPRGHAPSYPGSPLVALFGRDKELTRYSTAVPGLYLTGAGTFPGAGVSGAPGRNAAGAVLEAAGR